MNLDQQISDVLRQLQGAIDALKPVREDPRVICQHPEIYQSVAAADAKIRFSMNWLTSMKGPPKTAARRQRALTPWKEHTL
jgi:hypothetical protein